MVHLHIFRPILVIHPTCVFFSLVDDTHIVDLTSNVVFSFLQLEEELSALGLSMQPTKCVVWSPQRLDHSISLPFGFFTLDLGFHILGGLVGSTSFVESFVTKVFHEDLGMIFSLLMFANLQAIFAMLSFNIVLCLAFRLIALHSVSISRYFVALC